MPVTAFTATSPVDLAQQLADAGAATTDLIFGFKDGATFYAFRVT